MTWDAGWRYGIISTVPYEQQKIYRQIGPEHTGHFVQPHVAANCGGPEHTRATCGGDMYVMYPNALPVAGTSHSLWHT